MGTDYNPAHYDYRYNAPVCSGVPQHDGGRLWRLSCRNLEDQLFDVIDYYSMSQFVMVLQFMSTFYNRRFSFQSIHLFMKLICHLNQFNQIIHRGTRLIFLIS